MKNYVRLEQIGTRQGYKNSTGAQSRIQKWCGQDQKTKLCADMCERFFQKEHDFLLFRSKLPKTLCGHVRMTAYATTPLTCTQIYSSNNYSEYSNLSKI